MVEVCDLCKVFTRARHYGGRMGWLRSFVSREVITKVAVDHISFSIEEGELVGYVGPNGAGKSTTIKMLTGVLVPTAGRVEVKGVVPYRERIWHTQHMGVVFGQRTQLWWDLPVIESFQLLRHIYRVPAARYQENLAHFRSLLELDEFIHTPVRQLSLGQRMRADLAAAFLHDPDIVFLDEPTIGLDLVAKDRIREFVRDINQERGVTVILTTHDMADIESLCRRIMVIDSGQVILDGSQEEIRRRYGQKRVLVVDFEVEPGDFPGVPAEVQRRQGRRVWFQFSRERTTAARVISAIGECCAIRDFAIEETGIEDIIRRIYQNGVGDRAGVL
ncbi:MAG: ATP-binding cassette domain-containing protein [Bacillota bacterium]